MHLAHRLIPSARAIGAALFIALAAVACESPTDTPPVGPLSGFSESDPADSAGGPIPQPLSPSGSGHIVGTVIAPSPPGSGNDSLATAPRIAGVTIRVYPVVDVTDPGEFVLGPVAATITTDANGRFQTPAFENAGHGHVLTFTPPSGSPYAAVYVHTFFSAQSADWPWWVTLRIQQ